MTHEEQRKAFLAALGLADDPVVAEYIDVTRALQHPSRAGDDEAVDAVGELVTADEAPLFEQHEHEQAEAPIFAAIRHAKTYLGWTDERRPLDVPRLRRPRARTSHAHRRGHRARTTGTRGSPDSDDGGEPGDPPGARTAYRIGGAT
jgi:hypothetical protein